MRTLALLCFALALGVLAYWYFLSEPRHLATLTETLVPDGVDDFGDPKPKKWIKVVEPGLDLYGAVAGALMVLGGVFTFVARRRASRADA